MSIDISLLFIRFPVMLLQSGSDRAENHLKGVLNMKQSLIVMTIETGRVTIL
jgi:hypothetical protein